MEVLLSSIRPWQLLGGKIVGIGTLGVAQFAGTVAVALIAINATDAIDLPSFTAETLFHLVFWFLVGFLIYAFMFGAAGSLLTYAVADGDPARVRFMLGDDPCRNRLSGMLGREDTSLLRHAGPAVDDRGLRICGQARQSDDR